MFSTPLRTSRLTNARVLFLLFAFGLCCSAAAQQDAATVAFNFDFPGSEPEHFAVSVASDGHSVYDSNGRLTMQSDAGEPFHLEFTLSQTNRMKVFDLAKRAHYFEGEVDSKKPNLASTGVKVLSYKDAQKSTKATYNYSMIPAVQELTALFQNLSATLEFGRRLQYYQRYQKLALDEQLKQMEDMSKDNMLTELPAVAPILQSIAQDHSVMNMVRARALRLLAVAKADSAAR